MVKKLKEGVSHEWIEDAKMASAKSRRVHSFKAFAKMFLMVGLLGSNVAGGIENIPESEVATGTIKRNGTLTSTSMGGQSVYGAFYVFKAVANGTAMFKSKKPSSNTKFFISENNESDKTQNESKYVSKGSEYRINVVDRQSQKFEFEVTVPTATQDSLSSISISGSSSVSSSGSATYTCTAKMSGGTTKTVTPTWSMYSGGSYASISSSGKLTANNTTASAQTVTIQASYTEGGVTKTVQLTVTVLAKEGNQIEPDGDPKFTIRNGRLEAVSLNGATRIVIPDSVTSIGAFVFDNCTNLTSVTIPGSVTSIGAYAFDSCSNLTSVTIPSSVTNIANGAFSYCSKLTGVTIPNSVKDIGSFAFFRCVGLKSMTIPNSMTNIERYVFCGCSGLTSVTIPNSVTSIGECAFEFCSGLTGVTIPNSVMIIDDQAFWGCSGMTSVTIGRRVTRIGRSAFYGCSNLQSVIFSGDAPSCGEYAFSSVSANCVVKVLPTSTGWGTSGTWQGLQIQYRDAVSADDGSIDIATGAKAKIDVSFETAQIICTTLYKKSNNAFMGAVQLKIGKMGKKGVKVKATVLLMSGKKISAKPVNVWYTRDGETKGSLGFKDPIGAMDFTIWGDGTFDLHNDAYYSDSSLVGGKSSKRTLEFDASACPNKLDFGTGFEILSDFLPDSIPITVSGNKWILPKASNLMYKKFKAGGEVSYDLVVSGDTSMINVAGLKLKYDAKTGMFKGTFKVYASNENSISSWVKPKLKKCSASVIGFMLDGNGYGQATMKRPAATWAVWVD